MATTNTFSSLKPMAKESYSQQSYVKPIKMIKPLGKERFRKLKNLISTR